MSETRWIVTEYGLGPYLTKEAALADAAAFQKTAKAGAYLAHGKKPRLVQVRPKTADDIPDTFFAELLDDVCDLMEDTPRQEGFEAFDRELVPSVLEANLRRTLAEAYRGGVAATETDWVPTGVECDMHPAGSWIFPGDENE